MATHGAIDRVVRNDIDSISSHRSKGEEKKYYKCRITKNPANDHPYFWVFEMHESNGMVFQPENGKIWTSVKSCSDVWEKAIGKEAGGPLYFGLRSAEYRILRDEAEAADPLYKVAIHGLMIL